MVIKYMLKKIWDKILLKNAPIKLRLLVFFVVLSTIPVILVGYISFSLSLNILQNKAADFCTQNINQTSNEINDLFRKCEEIGTLVGSDPVIQETLRNPLEKNISKRFSTELRTDGSLNFMNSFAIKDIFGIYVLGENGGQYKSNPLSFRSDDMRKESFYLDAISSDKPVWFVSKNGSSVVITVPYANYVSVAMPVKDKLTGKNFGVVVIDLKEELLVNTITKSEIGNKGLFFIMDNDRYLFTSKTNDKIPILRNGKITNNRKTVYFTSQEGTKYIFLSNETISGWKVVGLISINELQRESFSITTSIIIFTLIVSIIAVTISFGVSSSVAKPIKKLMKLMKMVENGDLTVKMNSEYNDEIGQLIRSFGQMIIKLNELMNKIYSDQQVLRKAQLEVLQSQINPHFLYNTLDSVIWMSRDNRNKEVIEMVMALTKLLRISLSKGQEIISIEDELIHVKSYLTIQGMRYKDKLNYEINVPEEAYRYKILKLTLQPIIENAIYHGIKNSLESGIIKVNCEFESEKIIFIVEDTGVGMPPERVEELNGMLTSIGNGTGFGIRNVNERIKIHFGSEFGIKVQSTLGLGTKIFITIPMIAGENYVEVINR